MCQASIEIRKRGLIQALYVLSFGVIVAVIAWAVIYWFTFSIRAEYLQLRQEVATLENNTQDFEKRAGKAVLTTCGDDRRLCVEVEGTPCKDKTGRTYMIIKGY